MLAQTDFFERQAVLGLLRTNDKLEQRFVGHMFLVLAALTLRITRRASAKHLHGRVSEANGVNAVVSFHATPRLYPIRNPRQPTTDSCEVQACPQVLRIGADAWHFELELPALHFRLR